MRRTSLAAPVLAVLLLTACGSDSDQGPSSPETPSSLEGYGGSVSAGTACDDAISAMSYADDLLVNQGQEPYQDFDAAMRSRLSAVEGTLLNTDEWPSDDLADQAEIVQRLANEASRKDAGLPAVRALTEYRGEAARFILLCRDRAGDDN
jgi:hypothetical protein